MFVFIIKNIYCYPKYNLKWQVIYKTYLSIIIHTLAKNTEITQKIRGCIGNV